MRTRTILAKTLGFCSVGLLFLWGYQGVFAQSTSPLAISHAVVMGVQESKQLQISHKVVIANNSTDLVNRFVVSLPFLTVSDVQARLNGLKIKPISAPGRLSFDFKYQAIRPKQRAELTFSYAIPNQLEATYGLYTMEIPEFKLDRFTKDFQLTITYPTTFPALAYVSHPGVARQDGQLTTRSRNRMLLMWGTEMRVRLQDKVEALASGDQLIKQVLVNLIPERIGQRVSYVNSGITGTVATDVLGNAWISNNSSSVLELDVNVLKTMAAPVRLTPVKYDALDLPKDAPNLAAAEVGLLYKLEVIYKLALDRLQPALTTNRSYPAWDKLQAALTSPDIKPLTSLEYAYVVSGWLQKLNIPHHIEYGYIVNWRKFANFDNRWPLAWVRVETGQGTMILDPYMEDITGYRFFNIPDLNRVVLGVWNPEHTADSVLGLLNSSARNRPTLSGYALVDEIGDYSLQIEFPNLAEVAVPYTGHLVVRNNSARVLGISQVLWDNVDITDRAVQLNPFLQRGIRPFSEERIPVTGLVSQALFQQGPAQHTINLRPQALNAFNPVSATYDINYLGNNMLIVYVLLVLALVLILALVVVNRRYLRHLLFRS